MEHRQRKGFKNFITKTLWCFFLFKEKLNAECFCAFGQSSASESVRFVLLVTPFWWGHHFASGRQRARVLLCSWAASAWKSPLPPSWASEYMHVKTSAWGGGVCVWHLLRFFTDVWGLTLMDEVYATVLPQVCLCARVCFVGGGLEVWNLGVHVSTACSTEEECGKRSVC